MPQLIYTICGNRFESSIGPPKRVYTLRNFQIHPGPVSAASIDPGHFHAFYVCNALLPNPSAGAADTQSPYYFYYLRLHDSSQEAALVQQIRQESAHLWTAWTVDDREGGHSFIPCFLATKAYQLPSRNETLVAFTPRPGLVVRTTVVNDLYLRNNVIEAPRDLAALTWLTSICVRTHRGDEQTSADPPNRRGSFLHQT